MKDGNDDNDVMTIMTFINGAHFKCHSLLLS